MSLEIFSKCLAAYKLCENRQPLFLHNFGEVLLHPQLPAFLSLARERGVPCSFFTNGVLPGGAPYPREGWRRLADCGLKQVAFSAHALSREAFLQIVDGIVEVIAVWDPARSPRDTWAGQVGVEHGENGQPEVPRIGPCLFERENAFVVLWDGRVSSCCIDVEGRRSELWIDDILRERAYVFEGIDLCRGCGCYVEKKM